MLARFIKWLVGDLSDITPKRLNAFLLTVCAVFLFQQGMLSSEESYKYFDPYLLYWFKFLVGSFAAGAMALKTYLTNPNQ